MARSPHAGEGAHPKLYIASSELRQVTIRIHDRLGYTHFTQTLPVGDTTPELELPNFDRVPTGPYFIKITSGSYEVLLKMVKN